MSCPRGDISRSSSSSSSGSSGCSNADVVRSKRAKRRPRRRRLASSLCISPLPTCCAWLRLLFVATAAAALVCIITGASADTTIISAIQHTNAVNRVSRTATTTAAKIPTTTTTTTITSIRFLRGYDDKSSSESSSGKTAATLRATARDRKKRPNQHHAHDQDGGNDSADEGDGDGDGDGSPSDVDNDANVAGPSVTEASTPENSSPTNDVVSDKTRRPRPNGHKGKGGGANTTTTPTTAPSETTQDQSSEEGEAGNNNNNNNKNTGRSRKPTPTASPSSQGQASGGEVVAQAESGPSAAVGGEDIASGDVGGELLDDVVESGGEIALQGGNLPEGEASMISTPISPKQMDVGEQQQQDDIQGTATTSPAILYNATLNPATTAPSSIQQQGVTASPMMPSPSTTFSPSGTVSPSEALYSTQQPTSRPRRTRRPSPSSSPAAQSPAPSPAQQHPEQVSSSTTTSNPPMLDQQTLAQQQELDMKEQELEHEEAKVRRMSGFGAVFGILAMIFTAWQMSENPDGIYAAMCRLVLTICNLLIRLALAPCQRCCPNFLMPSIGYSGTNYRHSYGHVPSSLDYSYRDPALELS